MDAVISVGKKFIFKNVADRIFLKEIKKILVFFFPEAVNVLYVRELWLPNIFVS